MKWLQDIWVSLGISTSTAVFAFLGSLLAVVRHREASWKESVITFLTGFAFALVAPGLIVSYFGLSPNSGYYGGLGFVFGYFGMSIMDEVMRVIKDPAARQALANFILRR